MSTQEQDHEDSAAIMDGPPTFSIEDIYADQVVHSPSMRSQPAPVQEQSSLQSSHRATNALTVPRFTRNALGVNGHLATAFRRGNSTGDEIYQCHES
eukprot:869913-Karenia_brevis.AAC.1